jgi:rubredoxin
MRLELWLLLATAAIIANIYYDGKLWKSLHQYKKYYQMAAVGFGAIMLYILMRKNPNHAKQIISTSNDYLRYMPIDRNTSSMLSPILDFTSKYSGGEQSYPILDLSHQGLGLGGSGDKQSYAEARVMSSGGKGTKRSVSETKKKWVAAKQNWHCKHCGKQLPPWFEVDHIIRLDQGGSNHVDNLVALCRDCHGAKTSFENL